MFKNHSGDLVGIISDRCVGPSKPDWFCCWFCYV